VKDCQLASVALCTAARHLASTSSAPSSRREAERLLEWHELKVQAVLEQPLLTPLSAGGRETDEERLHSMLCSEGVLSLPIELKYDH